MTLQIALTPEMEVKLLKRAAVLGKDPAAFVLEVVEDELATDEPIEKSGEKTSLSPQQRIAELHAWAASHPRLPYEADDSRESIYEGRGE